MELRDVSAGDEIGFVAGVVDRPVTEFERANCFVGHTKEEWLAYNQAAGRHPLKNNHGEIVGRLLHTYVDCDGNLCAGALLDRAHASLWEDVRAGRVHAFSIGFDAVPVADGALPYKNKNFEVSLTSTPRKPFATIQVRCSEMADASAPPAAATTPAPAAPTSAASAPPMPDAMDADMIRQTEELRAKAAQWDAYQRAEQERLQAEQRSRLEAVLPVLRETGMDVDNEGQKAVLDALVCTPHTSALLTSMQKLAEERSALRAEAERLAAERAAAAEAAARTATESQRQAAFIEQLRMQFGGAGGDVKRSAVTPAAWNTTTPAELPPHQALAMNLNSIDSSLFTRAAAAAEAAKATVAPAVPTPAAVAAATQDGRIEMPKTPEERSRLAYQLLAMNMPAMEVAVRCSAESDNSGQQIAQKFVSTHRDTFAAHMFSQVPPIVWEIGLGDSDYWKKAINDVVVTGHHNGLPVAVSAPDRLGKCMAMQRPMWDQSAVPFLSLDRAN